MMLGSIYRPIYARLLLERTTMWAYMNLLYACSSVRHAELAFLYPPPAEVRAGVMSSDIRLSVRGRGL